MPRAARLRIPHVPLHVLQRGHNRARCFYEECDFCVYLNLLEEFSVASGCAIHAYVLMSNHVHLLLTPDGTDGPTDLMRAVNQRYVQYFNRRYERTGSVWEGRFKSSPVDSEPYLFTCQRYIELNPVRAGLAAFPGAYRWSSYRANAEGAPSSIVVPHTLFRGLGTAEDERRRNYRALFVRQLPVLELDSIRSAIRGNRPVGVAAGRAGRPRKDEIRVRP